MTLINTLVWSGTHIYKYITEYFNKITVLFKFEIVEMTPTLKKKNADID